MLRSRIALCFIVAATSALSVADVAAQNADWPPPESATDLSDPATWPDDPSYAYCPSASKYCGDDSESNGQWNYYSFVPVQSGNLTLRPEETSSGMSIDLAWRYSQGNDAVHIAVMDSGIKWDAFELLQRAWLNPIELANHKPTEADGSPCTGMDGFDCDGDGIFSARDYQWGPTPTLSPVGDGSCPPGDVNGNCVFDGGDVIQNFSDGIDDDNNGYVDDISGWDFMKDDNNPYDDTRYGHGTGEARDATAEGNDGHGGIGGCPNCRFLPMRVGDSFITDVNAFAKAVVYATDHGVRVVQCALGTINMNDFAQQALDYAYANGVLNITSMADENARHHNMPATSNHTLPVHAIQYSGSDKITNVETFLDFNPCTNYGGQNYLSVSGTGCSSEATGQLSGMAGLLFSYALEQNVEPPLTAAEAMQLWIHTADDIDVPESRVISEEGDPSKWSWSQPGFDQRFGYGRTNANTALEWIKDGKIPPEIDVVRPFWFEVLYADQLDGPVELRGHISAKRATSYDYVVEWAPGVEPLDGMFVEIGGLVNVPGDTVTGGSEPITTFDVRTMSTEHEWDSDSPLGENQYTITVRIRAVAHYGGSIGDVPGELRRTYYIYRDPDLVNGFPMYLGASGEMSPKMADIDGDGNRDLVYPTSDGKIHVLKLTSDGPKYVDGWPVVTPRVGGLSDNPADGEPSYLSAPGYDDGHVDPALAGDSISMAPAIGDLDDDGEEEIVVSTWNGWIVVYEADGSVKAGWPLQLPDVPSCPRDGTEPAGPCMDDDNIIDQGSFAAPVLEDMDKDGDLDIIQAAFDGKIYVYDADGNLLPNWPVELHYDGPLVSEEPDRGRILTTPAVADFNGDGYPDILTGSNEALGKGGFSGTFYLIDGRGTDAGDKPWFDNWPVTTNSMLIFPLVAEGTTSAGVIGRFDGTLAAVQHGNGSSPLLMPLDPGPQNNLNDVPPNVIPEWVDEDSGQTRRGVHPTGRFGPLSTADQPDIMFPLFANPSLGDIDQDGTLDVVASGSSLTLAQSLVGSSADSGQQLIAVWSGKTGAMLPASPFIIEDYSFFNSHAIADLNDDDYPEVIAGSGGYFLHAYDGCGREPEGWPKFTGQWMTATPAVGDMDGDGTLEVAIGTRSGWLHVWHTKGKADGMIQWESFHHDNRNTGNYDTPLGQGDPSRQAAEPMTVAFCEALLASDDAVPLKPGGGCGCRLGEETDDSRFNPWFASLLAAGILVGRRRRRARPTRHDLR